MTRESTNDGAASGGVPEAGAPPSRRGWPIFERERERERPLLHILREVQVSLSAIVQVKAAGCMSCLKLFQVKLL